MDTEQQVMQTNIGYEKHPLLDRWEGAFPADWRMGKVKLAKVVGRIGNPEKNYDKSNLHIHWMVFKY